MSGLPSRSALATSLGLSVGTARSVSINLGGGAGQDRVPDQVLRAEGLRLDMCPFSPDVRSVLGWSDQEPEFVFLFFIHFCYSD